MEVFIQRFQRLPIYLIYLPLLGLASKSKISNLAVPEWFVKQFANTPLDVFPGALEIQFFSIAALEVALTLLFALSLLKGESLHGAQTLFLRLALLGCCVLFAILSFGLRMVNDFNTGSQVFIYFIASFFLLGFFQKKDCL